MQLCLLFSVSITGNKVVDKGEKLTLICNATGTTEIPYGIEWWHNSKPLTSRLDKGIRIQTMKDPLKKTLISILTIADSDPENSGDYICRTSDKEVSEIKVHVLDGKRSSKTENKSRKLFHSFVLGVLSSHFKPVHSTECLPSTSTGFNSAL